MADCPSYWKPEMSELELLIKEYNQKNRLLENRIFSAEELSAYFVQIMKLRTEQQDALTEFFGGMIPAEVTQLMDWLCRPDIEADSKRRLFAFRQEAHIIPDTFDVLVERSFRYLPEHWHTNDSFIIRYCVNGNCKIHFEHEIVSLKPGNILIIAPNTLHAAPCYSDDEILIQFYLRTTTFKNVFWNNLSDMPLLSDFFSKGLSGEAGSPYLLYSIERDEQIDRMLFAVYQEGLQKQTLSQRVINGLLNIVFIMLLRNYSHTVHFSNTAEIRWKPEYLPVFQYIQEHYNDINMSDLQTQFNYSGRQLNRIIKSCTGKTFSTLIMELKMERAKQLLLYNNCSTEDVAEAVGYHDVNAFYRIFHSYTGITPRHWKLLNKEWSSNP